MSGNRAVAVGNCVLHGHSIKQRRSMTLPRSVDRACDTRSRADEQQRSCDCDVHATDSSSRRTKVSA